MSKNKWQIKVVAESSVWLLEIFYRGMIHFMSHDGRHHITLPKLLFPISFFCFLLPLLPIFYHAEVIRVNRTRHICPARPRDKLDYCGSITNRKNIRNGMALF